MKETIFQSGWFLQSSEKLTVHGEKISAPDFKVEAWLPVTVPGTVISGLVENKIHPDPYFSDNMTRIPGYKPQKDNVISNIPMPDNSPFRKSWWYRKVFDVPTLEPDQKFWLRFKGINYSANIWVNGKRVAGPDYVVGMFRIYDIDVTRWIKPDKENILAVEVFAQNPDDLGLSFIDWCPVPPDDSMGICQPVESHISGAVVLQNAMVSSRLDVPTLKQADLTLRVELRNTTDKPVYGILEGHLANGQFTHEFALDAFAVQKIVLNQETTPTLHINSPRIWWPYQMGNPELYELPLSLIVNGRISDTRTLSFGIREIASRITDNGVRLFSVNGKDVLIRGGAWTPDLMLRHSKERIEHDIRYLQNLHFNAIRIEGTLTPDDLWDECNRKGILVFTGLPASSHWEHWNEWKEGDLQTASLCLKSEIERIGNHACLAAFMYGSDFPPPENVERDFCDILEDLIPDVTRIASASAYPSKLQAVSGVKMTGPYSFVPPEYWYNKEMKGFAFGFNTEAGPDISIPQMESLNKMFAPKDLVVNGETWNHHAGLVFFKDTKPTDQAIEKRYGTPKDIEDYTKTAQVMSYECWRSLYEAHNREFPSATGIIAWKMNSPWPRLIWQLYDYFLNPTGGFFGSQKACEPLHAQYSYDDKSIWVVNNTREDASLILTASLHDIKGKKVFEKTEKVTCSSSQKKSCFIMPLLTKDSPIYFLVLRLTMADKLVSRNFYYLSSTPDILGVEDPKFFAVRPMIQYADFSALRTMPEARLEAVWTFHENGLDVEIKGALTNISDNPAFFCWIKIWDTGSNDYVQPIFWSDNCVSFLPGEKIEVSGTYPKDRLTGKAIVKVAGWNIPSF